MSRDLLILAGKSAYRHIREKGLSPSDIEVVLGASGAAKWLTIHGLDAVIFSRWFADRKDPLYLFGTSIGAWKFAAAASHDPLRSFDRLKDAYIHQYYNGRVTPDKVAKETQRIMDAFLSDRLMDEILSHPFLRIGFSAVRCKGLLSSPKGLVQAVGVWSAFDLNLLSRRFQRFCFDRVVFHDPRYDPSVMDWSDFPTDFIALNRLNFARALLASGSIPLIMEGVLNIPGARPGMYRDGGLLDYHPVLPLTPGRDRFVLYPHFYPHIIPGWFDKKLTRRRARGSLLDRVILLAPGPGYVSGLPFGRIPDRQDFIRLRGKDAQRVRAWDNAVDQSRRLGHEFMEAAETGRIRDLVRPI